MVFDLYLFGDLVRFCFGNAVRFAEKKSVVLPGDSQNCWVKWWGFSWKNPEFYRRFSGEIGGDLRKLT